MKYRFPVVLVLLSQLAIVSLAQQPIQRPAQPQPSPGQRPASPPQQSEDEVVRITTKLVQVDAVVTDRKGKVVTDLKPEEVQMSEDGRPQKITNFSYYVAAADPRAATAASPRTPDKNAPPIPPTRLRPEQVRRTIALVVDDLGLSFQSTYYVRAALKKFVDEQMEPGDLVAIIRTAGGMGALQQFTSDKRQLYAAIERVRWYATGRGGIGAFAPVGTALPGSEEATEAEERLDAFRDDIFAVGTLGALNYVVRGLRELPGRKSILLVSDGIRVFNLDDPTRTDRVLQAMRRLVDLANRASVVIYTMDARGLQTLGLSAADSVRPDQIDQVLSSRRADFFESQSGLSYLSEETGGIAIRNSNDLSRGVQRVLDDQKGYYLIGYRPDESTFDAQGRRKFHKLSLKILRPGKFDVRMRNGFFGISDEEAHPTAQTPEQQMISALTSPFGSAGIHLRLTSLFANDSKLGSIMRSLLHVDAKDLTFTQEPDGWHKAVFAIMAVTFGDNGIVVDQMSHTHTMRVPDAAYARMMKRGFVYFVTVPVKKPGAYQLRTALRDEGSSRVGSVSQFVEVPDIKKNRLTLSGVLVNSADQEQARKNEAAAGTTAPNANAGREVPDTNPTSSAALRQFKRGSAIAYGYFIYNAQLNKATGRPEMLTQIRLFRDGQTVFVGQEARWDGPRQLDLKRLTAGGAVQLGTNMAPGEYTLQVIVTDLLAKTKYRTATQWIDFEIVQ